MNVFQKIVESVNYSISGIEDNIPEGFDFAKIEIAKEFLEDLTPDLGNEIETLETEKGYFIKKSYSSDDIVFSPETDSERTYSLSKIIYTQKIDRKEVLDIVFLNGFEEIVSYRYDKDKVYNFLKKSGTQNLSELTLPNAPASVKKFIYDLIHYMNPESEVYIEKETNKIELDESINYSVANIDNGNNSFDVQINQDMFDGARERIEDLFPGDGEYQDLKDNAFKIDFSKSDICLYQHGKDIIELKSIEYYQALKYNEVYTFHIKVNGNICTFFYDKDEDVIETTFFSFTAVEDFVKEYFPKFPYKAFAFLHDFIHIFNIDSKITLKHTKSSKIYTLEESINYSILGLDNSETPDAITYSLEEKKKRFIEIFEELFGTDYTIEHLTFIDYIRLDEGITVCDKPFLEFLQLGWDCIRNEYRFVFRTFSNHKQSLVYNEDDDVISFIKKENSYESLESLINDVFKEYPTDAFMFIYDFIHMLNPYSTFAIKDNSSVVESINYSIANMENEDISEEDPKMARVYNFLLETTQDDIKIFNNGKDTVIYYPAKPYCLYDNEEEIFLKAVHFIDNDSDENLMIHLSITTNPYYFIFYNEKNDTIKLSDSYFSYKSLEELTTKRYYHIPVEAFDYVYDIIRVYNPYTKITLYSSDNITESINYSIAGYEENTEENIDKSKVARVKEFLEDAIPEIEIQDFKKQTIYFVEEPYSIYEGNGEEILFKSLTCTYENVSSPFMLRLITKNDASCIITYDAVNDTVEDFEKSKPTKCIEDIARNLSPDIPAIALEFAYDAIHAFNPYSKITLYSSDKMTESINYSIAGLSEPDENKVAFNPEKFEYAKETLEDILGDEIGHISKFKTQVALISDENPWDPDFLVYKSDNFKIYISRIVYNQNENTGAEDLIIHIVTKSRIVSKYTIRYNYVTDLLKIDNFETKSMSEILKRTDIYAVCKDFNEMCFYFYQIIKDMNPYTYIIPGDNITESINYSIANIDDTVTDDFQFDMEKFERAKELLIDMFSDEVDFFDHSNPDQCRFSVNAKIIKSKSTNIVLYKDDTHTIYLKFIAYSQRPYSHYERYNLNLIFHNFVYSISYLQNEDVIEIFSEKLKNIESLKTFNDFNSYPIEAFEFLYDFIHTVNPDSAIILKDVSMEEISESIDYSVSGLEDTVDKPQFNIERIEDIEYIFNSLFSDESTIKSGLHGNSYLILLNINKIGNSLYRSVVKFDADGKSKAEDTYLLEIKYWQKEKTHSETFELHLFSGKEKDKVVTYNLQDDMVNRYFSSSTKDLKTLKMYPESFLDFLYQFIHEVNPGSEIKFTKKKSRKVSESVNYSIASNEPEENVVKYNFAKIEDVEHIFKSIDPEEITVSEQESSHHYCVFLKAKQLSSTCKRTNIVFDKDSKFTKTICLTYIYYYQKENGSEIIDFYFLDYGKPTESEIYLSYNTKDDKISASHTIMKFKYLDIFKTYPKSALELVYDIIQEINPDTTITFYKNPVKESINYSINGLKDEEMSEPGLVYNPAEGFMHYSEKIPAIGKEYFDAMTDDIENNIIPQLLDLFPNMKITYQNKEDNNSIEYHLLVSPGENPITFTLKNDYLGKKIYDITFIFIENKVVNKDCIKFELQFASSHDQDILCVYFNNHMSEPCMLLDSLVHKNICEYSICELFSEVLSIFKLHYSPDYFYAGNDKEIKESIDYSIDGIKDDTVLYNGLIPHAQLSGSVKTFSDEYYEAMSDDIADNLIPDLLELFPYMSLSTQNKSKECDNYILEADNDEKAFKVRLRGTLYDYIVDDSINFIFVNLYHIDDHIEFELSLQGNRPLFIVRFNSASDEGPNIFCDTILDKDTIELFIEVANLIGLDLQVSDFIENPASLAESINYSVSGLEEPRYEFELDQEAKEVGIDNINSVFGEYATRNSETNDSKYIYQYYLFLEKLDGLVFGNYYIYGASYRQYLDNIDNRITSLYKLNFMSGSNIFSVEYNLTKDELLIYNINHSDVNVKNLAEVKNVPESLLKFIYEFCKFVNPDTSIKYQEIDINESINYSILGLEEPDNETIFNEVQLEDAKFKINSFFDEEIKVLSDTFADDHYRYEVEIIDNQFSLDRKYTFEYDDDKKLILNRLLYTQSLKNNIMSYGFYFSDSVIFLIYVPYNDALVTNLLEGKASIIEPKDRQRLKLLPGSLGTFISAFCQFVNPDTSLIYDDILDESINYSVSGLNSDTFEDNLFNEVKIEVANNNIQDFFELESYTEKRNKNYYVSDYIIETSDRKRFTFNKDLYLINISYIQWKYAEQEFYKFLYSENDLQMVIFYNVTKDIIDYNSLEYTDLKVKFLPESFAKFICDFCYFVNPDTQITYDKEVNQKQTLESVNYSVSGLDKEEEKKKFDDLKIEIARESLYDFFGEDIKDITEYPISDIYYMNANISNISFRGEMPVNFNNYYGIDLNLFEITYEQIRYSYKEEYLIRFRNPKSGDSYNIIYNKTNDLLYHNMERYSIGQNNKNIKVLKNYIRKLSDLVCSDDMLQFISEFCKGVNPDTKLYFDPKENISESVNYSVAGLDEEPERSKFDYARLDFVYETVQEYFDDPDLIMMRESEDTMRIEFVRDTTHMFDFKSLHLTEFIYKMQEYTYQETVEFAFATTNGYYYPVKYNITKDVLYSKTLGRYKEFTEFSSYTNVNEECKEFIISFINLLRDFDNPTKCH